MAQMVHNTPSHDDGGIRSEAPDHLTSHAGEVGTVVHQSIVTHPILGAAVGRGIRVQSAGRVGPAKWTSRFRLPKQSGAKRALARATPNGGGEVESPRRKPVPQSMLVDVPRLVTAYFAGKPDPAIPTQRVAFGTSGHRGSAFDNSFNEDHILAISQAICAHRRRKGIDGPLFIGIDTHALSAPALVSALEVFAANGIEIMVDAGGGYTPTPVISHAILSYNRNRKRGFADGVVITPSHNPPADGGFKYNPPADGGFKYNPPDGGPADAEVTGWIERTANEILADGLAQIRRMPYERARQSPTVHHHDYVASYVGDLADVIDMDAIRASGVRIGIDPLGGAAVGFWPAIVERYGIAATVVNDAIDPTFRFMTADWDGKIRRRAARRLARLRRRGERRGSLPAPRRNGMDDRQGRFDPRPAGRGDHRSDRAGSGPTL
jgi:hypothetical protein